MACTSPTHSPNPEVPANNTGGCSCEVRPRRCSETTAPWSQTERTGWNSPRPATFETEELVGGVGKRQAHRQRVEGVATVADIRERDPRSEDVAHGDLRRESQPSDVVDRIDHQYAADDAVCGGHESWRPVATATPAPGNPRPTHEAVGVERHHADRRNAPERSGHRGPAEHGHERVEGGIITERCPPMHDGGRGSCHIDDDIEGGTAEVDQLWHPTS